MKDSDSKKYEDAVKYPSLFRDLISQPFYVHFSFPYFRAFSMLAKVCHLKAYSNYFLCCRNWPGIKHQCNRIIAGPLINYLLYGVMIKNYHKKAWCTFTIGLVSRIVSRPKLGRAYSDSFLSSFDQYFFYKTDACFG